MKVTFRIKQSSLKIQRCRIKQESNPKLRKKKDMTRPGIYGRGGKTG
jgi:hypothetical protein